MCDEPLSLCSHEPGGDPSQPADVPEAVSAEDKLAKRILSGLGFCGHYMHFHGGGVSGKAPIICLLAKQPGGGKAILKLGLWGVGVGEAGEQGRARLGDRFG